MGCDIHLQVEIKDKEGVWHRAAPNEAVLHAWDYRHIAEQLLRDPNYVYYRSKLKWGWYDDRDYAVFAILADVRNDDELACIAEPKGLPDDMGPELRDAVSYYEHLPDDDEDEKSRTEDTFDLGEHSFSWLTLKELQEFPWHESHGSVSGILDWAEYVKFAKRRLLDPFATPESWCGGCGGPNVTVHEDRPGLLDEIIPPKALHSTYVQVTWTQTYAQLGSRFYKDVMPALARLARRDGLGPEDVRIVFGFDS